MGIENYVEAKEFLYRNRKEDIVVIYRKEIEDKTCLIDPVFAIGEYDYMNENGNRTIAKFYNKKAVYLMIENDTDM